MTEQLWWYVARSSGIVSLFLAGGAVIWGLLLSGGYLERNPTKKWLLALHRWLGGMTVAFTGVHLVGLWLDGFVDYGVFDLLVPFVGSNPPGPLPMAWGIICAYLLLAVQLTSVMMRRMPRRWWGRIHLLSYLVLLTGIVHGITAGTDGSNIVFLGATAAMGLTTVFLTTYRVLMRRPRRARTPSLAT
ncbi:MAG: ferric reductase-like transmembrane domain-containing protein [Acidimicrobiia bacterium]|nr:ferric reductase-like transmembrane domain-containing protein [Acidimicrobiia bacterium]